MRQSAVLVVLVAAVALGACKKNPPVVAPAPVAPATPPPAPPPPAPPPAPQISEYDRIKNMSPDEIDKLGLLPDIRFDYDKADLREGDRQILAKNAETLKNFDFLKISVEGHCDDRGTVEYNLALGDKRAKAVYDYLTSVGVATDRLKATSYGKEVPLCQQATEECWARNRRAKFTVTGKTSR